MPVYSVSGGTAGSATDLDQLVDAISANNDTDITLYAQLSPPAAPTVSVNTTSGNLTGNYQYALGFETGYWQGPTGSGTFHVKGNTGGGAASVTVSPNAQEVNVDIPTSPTGVGYVLVYRTQANGSTFYYLDSVLANTSSQFTDNTPDSGLGAAMPTTNTTGGKFSGDASGLTNLPAANLVGGPIPAAVLPPADTTTLGTVEVAQNPASGAPIAVITNPASQAGQSINGPLTVVDLSVSGMTGAQTQSRYVGAVSGAAPTTGTFDVGDFVIDVTNLTLWICTAAGSPGTWSNFNYLRLGANAPNPQTVANTVNLGGVNINGNQVNSIGTQELALNFANTAELVHVYSALEVAGNGTFAATLQAQTLTSNGNVYDSSGQLGSASGTWTPASGTFNVTAGTVINVASVPSAAKMYTVKFNDALNNDQVIAIGNTTSSGSAWFTYGDGTTVANSSGISGGIALGANSINLGDGSYITYGYFQLNGGYLQFVTTSAGSASTSAASNLLWAVS